MIKVFLHGQLGHFQNEWLDSRHHFSFGDYYNPERRKFHSLRVINDDTIKAGKGFPPHSHNDMEIITYVRSGSIRHTDNLGNEGITQAGDIQVMSAGTGIIHGEYADTNNETTLFQIWIIPDKKGFQPRWGQAEFPKEYVGDHLRLLISGREGEGAPLHIHQNAAIFGGRIKQGQAVTHRLQQPAYILVSDGKLTVNEKTMARGDGAEVEGEQTLEFTAKSDCEVLVIEV
jgi:redox-sensitive bicupin YhaK (pirin superfamily)